MLVKRLKDCRKFISGDGAVLRELLHSGKGDFKFRYSLAHALVAPGKATRPHILKISEVYYIIKGSAIMNIGKESGRVSAGCAVYIPPGKIQYIRNTGRKTLEFLCIVDPAWRPKDEKVIPAVPEAAYRGTAL